MKVSVIVPCYNQAIYLEDALWSVLNQTYSNWECIIVNDGSIDNTEDVAKLWTKKDARFSYLFQNNSGISSARNLGIKNAKGELILPLDADDKIGDEYLKWGINSFQQDNSIKLVYCRAMKFGDESGLWNLGTFSRINLIRYNMIFCSAIFHKSEWKQVGGYDVKMKDGLEDWEFWIALLKKGGNVKCLDYVGFFYRIRKDSRNNSLKLKQIKFYENYIHKKHIDFLLENYDSLSVTNKNLSIENTLLKQNLKSEKILLNELFFQILGFRLFKLKK